MAEWLEILLVEGVGIEEVVAVREIVVIECVILAVVILGGGTTALFEMELVFLLRNSIIGRIIASVIIVRREATTMHMVRRQAKTGPNLLGRPGEGSTL